MNPDQQNVRPLGTIVLTADDVSTEEVSNVNPAEVSADRMEDISYQANEQNFQNN
jgi:hypothetical protein